MSEIYTNKQKKKNRKEAEMKIVEVTIVGTAPLLMNKWNNENSDSKKKKDYPMDEEAKKRLYVTDNGKLFCPAEHIEGALIKAGADHKFKGRKTYKEFLKSGIYVKPAQIIHKIQNWDIDTRSVVLNRKDRIIRHRPRMAEWSVDFTIEIHNDQIVANDLQLILQDAGQYIGIGDYRPKYGRFRVEKFKVLK